MAADAVVVDGCKVLIVTEALSEACTHLVSSLKSRQCSVALSGVNANKTADLDCKFIASDLASGPGRDNLAQKHFEDYQWIVLLCGNISQSADPVQVNAASSIEALSSSANRNRHLLALFQAAVQPKYIMYVTAMSSSAYFGNGNVAVFARSCRLGKLILEVLIKEGTSSSAFWNEIWQQMVNGQFTSLNDDTIVTEGDTLWTTQGDTLSRSSSRKNEKHPWNVQDCSFFP